MTKKIKISYHLNCNICGGLFWSADAWKLYCPKCSYLPMDRLHNTVTMHDLKVADGELPINEYLLDE